MRFFVCSILIAFTAQLLPAQETGDADLPINALILETIHRSMPKGGTYAKYRKELPGDKRFDDLYQTVADLDKALAVKPGGGLKVDPDKAKNYSFCSSATYLLFGEVVESLQQSGAVEKNAKLNKELAWTGSKFDVIQGKLDGVGIFGHWNADGPGTAALFHLLDLGPNFTSYEKARPGDFMKIFWNEHIGKGERGHLVVYLGETRDKKSVKVWSSQTENDDGSAGYGIMTVEKSRIKRVVFSRLLRPENLKRWLDLPEEKRTSDYLVQI
ncbi:MAG: hypothetical protein HKN23_17305, partial [Verrucomicrobiales bacterium]|nr:hypothetical protein [Verrucomicrobiales bacterium]